MDREEGAVAAREGRLRKIGIAFIGFLAVSAVLAYAQGAAGGRIESHAVRAVIEPASARLAVTDTVTIHHDAGTAASMAFPVLLSKDLRVDSVQGLEAPVAFREERLRPRDYWEDPPYDEIGGYDRARTIAIQPAQLDGNWPERMRVVIAYSGSVYDSLRAPKSAYARGFETTSGLIDARGTYMSYGTFWVPTRPAERFTFRCAIETPGDWHGVSQGALLHSAPAGDRRVNVWECAEPMEEIYLIAGPYTLRQEERAGVAVMTFTYANTDEALCKRYIDGTERYLRLYGEMIGPYPFPKFALVENFWQTGFGMPSFTLLGDAVIRLPFILDTSYGHEILHNWWGNGVFVDYESGNWCEGLTTYGADYLYKERQSESEARDYRRTALQGYFDYVSGNEDSPLRLFREREDFASQAIGYGKSMMVFHQIRRTMGDDRFLRALQSFYLEHRFRRASWDDLFDAFSRESGRALGAWKTQWLDRIGAPVLVLKQTAAGGSPESGYRLDVTIAQVQPELYEIEVPVRVGWDDIEGDSTQVVAMYGREAICRFELKRLPDWVAVDPDFDLLRRIDPAEIPPALSRTLGADTSVAVIASGLSEEERAAYEKLAEEWARGAKLAILSEADLKGAPPAGVAAWFLGLGPMARSRIATLRDQGVLAPAGGDGIWRIAGAEYPRSHGAVLAGGELPGCWTVVAAPDAQQIGSIGRKIPHYGKYGYLVFEGATNVAKGSWEVLASPLRADLKGDQ